MEKIFENVPTISLIGMVLIYVLQIAIVLFFTVAYLFEDKKETKNFFMKGGFINTFNNVFICIMLFVLFVSPVLGTVLTFPSCDGFSCEKSPGKYVVFILSIGCILMIAGAIF